MDLLEELFRELFKSEPFKAFVVVCLIVAVIGIFQKLVKLRVDFDSHVAEENVTLTSLSEAIKGLKEARTADAEQIATTLGEIKDDIRLILSTLLPARAAAASARVGK